MLQTKSFTTAISVLIQYSESIPAAPEDNQAALGGIGKDEDCHNDDDEKSNAGAPPGRTIYDDFEEDDLL